MHGTSEASEALARLLESASLSRDTILYRHTLPEHLTESPELVTYHLTANNDPSESVEDVYGQGHIRLACDVGPGLAFAESLDTEWAQEGRVPVALRLGDALDDGSLIYPVLSVTTERVWYVTSVNRTFVVRRVDRLMDGDRRGATDSP